LFFLATDQTPHPNASSIFIGKLTLPAAAGGSFLIYAYRDSDLNFAFDVGTINGTFTKLKLPATDDQSLFCVTGKVSSTVIQGSIL
jgi:hypothetical protein